MARHLIPLLGIALLLGACGGSSTTESTAAVVAPIDTAATVAAPGQVGSIGDAVEVAAGAPDAANNAACELDRSMLTSASEMYLTLNGTSPTSQSDLVEAQLITELSPRFEITPDGVIVPAPASPCT